MWKIQEGAVQHFPKHSSFLYSLDRFSNRFSRDAREHCRTPDSEWRNLLAEDEVFFFLSSPKMKSSNLQKRKGDAYWPLEFIFQISSIASTFSREKYLWSTRKKIHLPQIFSILQKILDTGKYFKNGSWILLMENGRADVNSEFTIQRDWPYLNL